ncbi:MFS transporter [Leifsonia kafniensis]
MSSHTGSHPTITTSSVGTDGPRAGRRGWWALAVLMLPVLLISIDNTVLNLALPSISEDLKPSGTELLWMIDIYPLVLAALLVSMGSLGDRVGRRKLLLIGSAGFGVVSVLASFATSIEMLIIARAALGFFGAMLMPSTMSLLRSVFTNRDQRRLAIAVWASGFAAGSAFGPVIGGFLLEHYSWGSVFLLAVPFLVPLFIFVPILVPESRDPDPGRIDILSILLSLAAMAPIVFGIKTFAERGFDVVPLVSVLIGLVAGYLFVRRQARLSHPMLDLRLFHKGAFSGAIGVNLLSVVALVGGLFFISQYLQLVLGLSPLVAGLVLVPGLLVMIISGLVVVPIARRVRPSTLIPIGLLITASGYVSVALMGDGISALGIGVVFVAFGIGIGAAETVSNELVIANAPAEKMGAASAVSETAYELGAVLGTAILGTIMTASYRNTVAIPEGLSTEQQHAAHETLGGAVAVAEQLPPVPGAALLESAQHAFASGIGPTAWIGAALVLAAAVVAVTTLRKAR